MKDWRNLFNGKAPAAPRLPRYKTLLQLVLVSGFLIFMPACQTPPPFDPDVDEFLLQNGFKIELIAAEPLLDSPVAMAIDARGRIWAAELPGYMRDIDGSGENEADGRIVVLEDSDGDGRMDQRSVFLDGLVAPRTLALVYGGLLYTDARSLWWIEVNGISPGSRVLVDSLYVIGGNIEHQPNGLLYNLDNWIYSARSSARYRRINGRWTREAAALRGQWGLSSDDQGRLYYNDNSNPLFGDYLMPNQLINHPYHAARFGVSRQIATDRRVFPWQATAVNRGYLDGVLDDRGRLRYLTSACAPLIYRGHQFSADLYGDAFICAPEVNTIKRYRMMETDGFPSANQAYEGEEFLVSTDETFRPVNLCTGMDGALYVLDLRKGIIQHRAYMSSYLREKILAEGLEQVKGKGRVYRITSTAASFKVPVQLEREDAQSLPELLGHPNGEVRIRAQQQIIMRNEPGSLAKLTDAALNPSTLYGQIHALWTLEGLGKLEPELIRQVGESASEPLLIQQLVRLGGLFPAANPLANLLPRWAASGSEPLLMLQIAHTSGLMPGESAQATWLKLAGMYGNDPLFCEALISGIEGREEAHLATLMPSSGADTLRQFLREAIENRMNEQVQAPQLMARPFQDMRTRGFELYGTICASCHGLDGKGTPHVAPPILNSWYLDGSEEKLILLALHGLQGPVTVNGKRYVFNQVMPGLKDNPDLSDRDIADILVFVRNSFSFETGPISAKRVEQLRRETAVRKMPYSEAELKTR